jgi:hypothetical protein
MKKRLCTLVVLCFIASYPPLWGQNFDRTYAWSDEQLFGYLNKFEDSGFKSRQRHENINKVIEELRRKGIQKQKDPTWTQNAFDALDTYHQATKSDSYAQSQTERVLNQAVKQVSRNYLHLKKDPKNSFSPKLPNKMGSYFQSYGEQIQRSDREVLESLKITNQLGNNQAAEALFERYANHRDISGQSAGKKIHNVLKQNPDLIETAKQSIMNAENTGQVSKLEYPLFEYTKEAPAENKQMLNSIWQEALKQTQNETNQQLWSSYLLEQADQKSLKAVFDTDFINRGQGKRNRQQALEQLSNETLISLVQREPYLDPEKRPIMGVIQASLGASSRTMSADEFNIVARRLKISNPQSAAEASIKALQADSRPGTGFIYGDALDTLVDLASSGEASAHNTLSSLFFKSVFPPRRKNETITRNEFQNRRLERESFFEDRFDKQKFQLKPQDLEALIFKLGEAQNPLFIGFLESALDQDESLAAQKQALKGLGKLMIVDSDKRDQYIKERGITHTQKYLESKRAMAAITNHLYTSNDLSVKRAALSEIKKNSYYAQPHLEKLEETMVSTPHHAFKEEIALTLLNIGSSYPEGFRAVLDTPDLSSNLRLSAFDALVKKRNEIESKKDLERFDSAHGPSLRNLIHDHSNDKLRRLALDYYLGKRDSQLMPNLIDEALMLSMLAA